MRNPWRWPYLAAAFLAPLVLGFLLQSRVNAQTRGAIPAGDKAGADTDDADPQPFFTVSMSLEASGKTSVQVIYDLADKSDLPPTEIKKALQSALGCTLQDLPHTYPTPGFYFGSCTMPLSSHWLLHEGRISTAPLQELCRLHKTEPSSVQLRLPDSDVLESFPAVHRDVAASPKMPESLNRYLRSIFVYPGSLQQPFPPEIIFRFGYASATLERAAALLLFVLFSPVALFLWLGRKALSADVADKAVVWFSYMHSLAWILSGSVVGWWIALDYCHAEPLLGFLLSGTRFDALAAHPATYEVLTWVPPAIIWILCYRISHPVQQKLRGLQWTRRELTLQALYSVLAGLFPLVMFLTGLRVMGTSGVNIALLWWLSALLLRRFAAQALLKLTGTRPQALSSGDLRDRAFGMAERMGVKLQQVYLIPSGKGQVANAYARRGNSILFTDVVLRRMSRREVDYILGHELTHLKLKHPAKLGYAYLGGMFLAIVASRMSLAFLHGTVALNYLLIFGIISIFPYFWSRHFEYGADAGAVAATGDPRGAISALFKLSELNMTPIDWSKWREKGLTHPSSLRRARAIAKRAGIPFEEIPAIVREGAAETQNYEIPASAQPGGKIHSTHRTQSQSLKLSYILISGVALVPSLFSLAAVQSASPVKWILFAAALPAALLFFLLLSNYAPRLTRDNINSSLNKKFADQGVQAASWNGVFVGLSPAAAPRIYGGSTNWDIGCLFLRSDRVCYYGEESRFALFHRQITAIKLSEGWPGLLSTKRIYIAWKDDERAACGVFSIRCSNPGSTLQTNKITADLARRLQVWWKTPPVTRPMPTKLAELTSPEVRPVTSQSPAQRWKAQKVSRELLWTGIFAAAGATLCGLPFHLLPYVMMSSLTSFYSRAGIRNPFPTPGAGWFAVAVAVLFRLITLLPALRYRDMPKLTAVAPANRGGMEARSTVTQPAPVAPEKLLVS
ncbi:MAG TPA: M48 family metalloprotease [Methylomirabilota bacterium]|nr:M48 family metalloprotease [Methylomirabilota bacterium]